MFSSPRTARIIEDCETLVRSKDDAWSIDHGSGVFLHQLAVIRGAKVIAEIGTSYGHSGLFLADAALRNRGKFWTLEQNPKKVLIARQYLTQAGLDGVATVVEGTAPDALSGAPDGVEMLFIDATKAEQDAYLDLMWPKLAARAVIVTDNATTHGEEMAGFLKRLREDRRLISSLVPIGNGMELSVRVG